MISSVSHLRILEANIHDGFTYDFKEDEAQGARNATTDARA